MQQLWNVLGPEGSKYVVWLTIAIGLVIAVLFVLWIASIVFGRGLNFSAGGRGQQPQRLGITGAFNVDRKGRKLVILRRDNVEHLVLIGGPNDVLIESNIIRAAERGGARPAANQPTISDAVLAPAVLPGAPATSAPVALPAATVPPPAPPARTTVPPAPPVVDRQPAPVPRPAEQPVRVDPPPAPRAAAPPVAPPQPRAAVQPTSRPPEPGIRVEPPAQQARQNAQPASPPQSAPAQQPLPSQPAPQAAQQQQAPQPVAIVETRTAAEPQNPAQPSETRLSDMARRLQSVLKQPLTPVGSRAPDPVAAAKAENIPIPLPSRSAETRAVDTAPEPVTQGKPVSATPAKPDTTAIDSLEEEMARLLGRTGPDKR